MPANSTPSVTGTGTNWYDADYYAFSPLSGVTISDTDPSAIDTVTITLTVRGVPSDADGTLSGTNLTQTGVGTYVLAADTPGNLTAELEALVFTPTDGQVPLGQVVTTGVTIAVTDGGQTVTDSTTVINVTAENPYAAGYGNDGSTGVAGIVHGRGGAGQSVTETAYSSAGATDVNPAQGSLANAEGGNGGTGADATSAQSGAGSGGAGGSATVKATAVSEVPSAYEAIATAFGGDGGDGGQNSFTNTGGNGGTGGSATATAYDTGIFGSNPGLEIYSFAVALSQGGTGGTAYGSGATGGTGGAASATKATAASDNSAIAEAIQSGGDGGDGIDGANGGAGASSTLVNAVSILSSGAGTGFPSILDQEAYGGDGGDSDTGHGGNGGYAISDMTADYSANPAIAGVLEAEIHGGGGDGGDGAIGGNGGATWDAATLKGAGFVYVGVIADGGDAGANGQAGGDGQAKATGVGAYVDIDAHATGGFGPVIAGIANATAAGTGMAGGVSAETYTGLYDGNLITTVFGQATADVDGTNTALSQAGIATTMPSSPGGAIAYIDALPVAAYAARAEAGAPHTIAALGATPGVIAMGEIGGAHSTLGTDTQTSTATIGLSMDLLQLTSTTDLFLGFYGVGGSSSGVTDINLEFDVNGAAVSTLDYGSVAAAKTALNDSPMDIGSVSSLLSQGSSLDLQVALSVTTSHAGGSFSTYLVLGHG